VANLDEMERASVVKVASLSDKAQETALLPYRNRSHWQSEIVSNCFRKTSGFVTVLVVESVEGVSWDTRSLFSDGAICIRSALANSL
jgi:hypothetical protein